MGPGAVLHNFKWEKISWPAKNPASSPVTILTELFWVYQVRMRFKLNRADSMLCHLPPSFHIFCREKTAKWNDTEMCVFHVKGKAILLQAWTGPEGSRRFRLPFFNTISTWRWLGCQPYALAAFTPLKYSWYSILLEMRSQSQGHSLAGRIMSMKNSSETIGNRTHALPTCSAVPQPACPPHAPYVPCMCIKGCYILI